MSTYVREKVLRIPFENCLKYVLFQIGLPAMI